MLTTRRKEQHAAIIHTITERAYHYYHAPPHPSEIQGADRELKRGIDDDWKASVQRYPEVLEYFYSLVDLSLPGDDEPHVRDPPMSALGGGKQKVRLREGGGEERRRRRSRVIEEEPFVERRERRARPAVAFAPMPGVGYVSPRGYH